MDFNIKVLSLTVASLNSVIKRVSKLLREEKADNIGILGF